MENETHEIIDSVCSYYCKQFKFGYYDADDIYQEAYILCLEALDKFDSERGSLRSFLSTHVRNRLLTLRRDKLFRNNSPCKGCPFRDLAQVSKCKEFINRYDCDLYRDWEGRTSAKQNLMEPVGFDSPENSVLSHQQENELDVEEIKLLYSRIEDSLDFKERKLLLQMMEGAPVNRFKQKDVFDKIRGLLSENG